MPPETQTNEIDVAEIIRKRKLYLATALKTINDVASTQKRATVTFLAAMIHIRTLLDMCHAKPHQQKRNIVNNPAEFKKLLESVLGIIKELSRKRLETRQQNGLSDAQEEIQHIIALLSGQDETQEIPRQEPEMAEPIADALREEIKAAAMNVAQILKTDILPNAGRFADPVSRYVETFEILANLALTAETKNELFHAIKGRKQSVKTIINNFGTPHVTPQLRDLRNILEKAQIRLQ